MSAAACSQSLRPNQVAGGITGLTPKSAPSSFAMAASKTIYVSSRKSQLAMYQTNEVIGKLQASADILRGLGHQETDTARVL
jgi:hypothetical protein